MPPLFPPLPPFSPPCLPLVSPFSPCPVLPPVLPLPSVFSPPKTWQVNAAESEYWKRNEGYRVGYSDELLQFDCGGQQWVLEMAMPAGTVAHPNAEDVVYVRRLLRKIEKRRIPAPAPIEQRWSCGSTSVLSPAASSGANPHEALFSWVGIIMYMPPDKVGECTHVRVTAPSQLLTNPPSTLYTHCPLPSQHPPPSERRSDRWINRSISCTCASLRGLIPD